MKKTTLIILFCTLCTIYGYTLNPQSTFNQKAEIFLSSFDSFDSVCLFLNANMYDNLILGYAGMMILLGDDIRRYGYDTAFLGYHVRSTFNHILQTIKGVDMRDITDEEKRTLRLIMFFHDLGKADPGDHNINSEKITRYFLEDLGMESSYISFICKIVLHHSDLGEYPNNKHDLSLLSKEEFRWVYLTGLCDIEDREPYNSKFNRKRLLDIYNTVGTKHEPVLRKKILRINVLLRPFKFLWENNVYNYYRLKDLFYSFDIKLSRQIEMSV